MTQYTKRYRKRKHFMEAAISFVLVAAIFAICLTVRSLGHSETSLPTKDDQPSLPAESQPMDSSLLEEPSSTQDSSPAPPQSESESSSESSDPVAEMPVLVEGDVPPSQPVDTSYFDDAVFIGDSRTEGFTMYNNISKSNSLTYKGLMVDTAFTEPCINVNGVKMTVMDALAQKHFSKVYVMLGVNELGWVYSDVFIHKYGEIIDRIREINPQATIYIQSILPVTKKKSDSDSIYNNSKINQYNTLLRELAKEKQVNFVNVAQAVMDSDGTLPENLAFDGVHLNREGCEKWMDYLKSHVVV